ncbi:uncharacterized protein TNCT_59601 [Trichonephila clavata]|uniref:Uncharacterized protein n=1 Tax=Trichonephila clavata TaxID=2740835 RepID=A0A8X6I2P9_TRICU|nr:uncharacterized protein TNCT_59601 [Trichonephila clavata]
MNRIYGCLFILCLTKFICEATNLESHLYQLHNLTSANAKSTLISEASKIVEHPHYIQPPQEYFHNYEEFLSRNANGNQFPGSTYRNSHLMDFENHQKQSASIPDVKVFRIMPHQDHQVHHMDHHGTDFGVLKKHDFGNDQNFGWDIFPTGHGNSGGGLGLGQVAGAGLLKKGKEAKTLFILMAPLILLAVFGPILATQAMIPWVANGGLTSVSTIAGGKRRKRQLSQNFRSRPDLERRLQLFIEVQDFIARTGSQDLVQEMGEAFLRCQRYTERRNKCLERVACAYTDNTSVLDREERRIGRMVLQNVMTNPLVPASLAGKLKKGFLVGKKHPGQCINFWCDVVDNPKNKPK